MSTDTDSSGSSANSEITKKRRVRGGHKAYVTRALGEIRNRLDSQLTETLSLKQNKLMLEEKLITVNNLDDQILDLLDEEAEIATEIDESGLFRENVRKVLLEIEEKLKSFEMASQGSTVTPTASQQGLRQQTPHGGASFTKLPKLQLRKFYGKPDKWQEFWDSFKTSVDSNPGLSNCSKLEYLRAQCEGSAYHTIAGLELTDNNYQIAVDLLKGRFGQRQMVLNSHIDALLKIDPVNKNANIYDLRKFYDSIETHGRGLQALKVDPKTYGTVLVNVLLQKLPEEIQLIISRKMSELYNSEEDWELTKMLESLKLEIEAREKCIPTRKEPMRREVRRNLQENYATAATLATGARNKQNCTFCQGDHGTAGCKVVTNMQERRNILRKSGRCFSCLKRAGHLAKNCDASIKCFNCRGNHHVALCERNKSYQGNFENNTYNGGRVNSSTQSSQTDASPQTSTFCGINNEEACTNRGILLQTAFVVASNPQEQSRAVNLRIILDSGSQRSYITEKARNVLNLATLRRENMVIKVFGSNEGETRTCDIINVDLCNRKNKSNIGVEALVVPTICSPVQGQTVRFAKEKYHHLKNLHLADFPKENETDLSVDVLIGSDNIWRILTGEIIEGGSHEEPVAVGTKFGWVLSGVVSNVPRNLLSSVNLATTHILRVDCRSPIVYENESQKVESEMDKRVEELFQLETLGINNVDSVDEQFSKDLKYENGHYIISLPWRDHHDILPDNYELCVARLHSTLKRLRKEPDLLKEYNNIIEEQLRQGIIEEVKPNLFEPTVAGKTHYLSHHAVVRRDATTTKVRVVMDGSAKINADSPSLNECLYTGPSLNPKIFDILLRFRYYNVALISDVRKAFHMIHVNEQDRDALRFLWINDVETENPEIVIFRFTRVVFGLNCSPFLLGATLSHHIKGYEFEDSKIGERLQQSIYVDDVVFGEENATEAYNLYKETKNCLSKGSFQLHKFRCSDPEVQKTIERENGKDIQIKPESYCESDQTAHPNIILGDDSPLELTETKVLGMKWDYEKDVILLKFAKFVELGRQLSPTKRNLLKLAASIFDPIGLVSPVVVKLRILLQEICELKLKWDTPLPENLKAIWLEIVRDLDQVTKVCVPRCYFVKEQPSHQNIELHGFCDASTKAYCAVIYIIICSDNVTERKLIASKARVAPFKKLTIQRLELMGAVILARLIETVKSALEGQILFESIRCWTDSTIVLAWVKNNRNFKQFVSHRIKEILQLTTPEQWQYCPTNKNPADIGSRGQSLVALSENNLWWYGPEWLMGPEEIYPKQPSVKELETSTCFEEIRSDNTVLLVDSQEQLKPNLDGIIDINRFSSLNKLLKVTAYVLRFISNTKAKIRKQTTEIDGITANEIERAESLWVITVQNSLQKEENFKQLERQLGLFQDEAGIIRCRGRIGNSSLRFETKFPALLQQGHHLTTLIIYDAHERSYHNGTKSTLNEVRTKYWIPRGRQRVRKILHDCNYCRRFESQAYKYPSSPHLPEFRVQGTTAFESVGTDLAGPLLIRFSRKETTYRKVWIVIFTCTLSRAIHLELMQDMSTEQFLLALRRFIARRGVPNLIISDNAKYFKKAEKLLSNIFKDPEVKKYLTSKRINWAFNLEEAPWYGSIYERLIKSVKQCLRKVLRNAKLTADELYTILVEIENTLNNRPLTYLSSDEFDIALTPSHLICGRKLNSLPYSASNDTIENSDRNGLIKRQSYILKLLDHWWKRWRDDYLIELRESHNLSPNNRGEPTIKVGDVVTVHQDKTPRGFWRLGRVEKLITSKDSKIRGAVVKVVTTTGHVSLINRPIKKLFPVEIPERNPMSLLESNDNENVEKETRRSKRIAALDADVIRRLRE